MKEKWKKANANSYDIAVPVVGDGSIASENVANGRNIPVVIVQPDSKNVIENIILVHEDISYGHCDSQWGMTDDHKNILLALEFKDPIASRILISFDIIEYGMLVDQIVYAQCMYIMTGESGTKLSDNLGKAMVLLEIPVEGFADEWNHIYKKTFAKHIQKKYNISLKESNEIFDKVNQELRTIKTLRMK